MKVFFLQFVLPVLIAISLDVRSLASIAPPPDPNESCASAEYQKLKAQSPAQLQPGTPSEPSTLMIVAGRKPLNTTQQIKMGQQVTVCIMGLHDWIYKQKKNPDTLRLFIGGYLLTKMPPTAISPASQEYLNFTLQMDSANSDDWKSWAAI